VRRVVVENEMHIEHLVHGGVELVQEPDERKGRSAEAEAGAIPASAARDRPVRTEMLTPLVPSHAPSF
jgi:hypothetical protein